MHDNVHRISGTEIAGSPAVKEIVKLMKETKVSLGDLKYLDSFEEVLVGMFLNKFHLMREKQKKYGKLNISKGGMFGLVTRATDKLERMKNLVGNPEEQINEARQIAADLVEADNDRDVMLLVNALNSALNPANDTDESMEDTAIDSGNYGDIMGIVLADAWGKDMEKD